MWSRATTWIIWWGGKLASSNVFNRLPNKLFFFQWQRIALARAFMRANEPNVDLLLFDEPVRVRFPEDFFNL